MQGEKTNMNNLYEAIEKANQLNELLREAQGRINSLSRGVRIIKVESVLTNCADGNSDNLVKENDDFSHLHDVVRRHSKRCVSKDDEAIGIFG